MYVALGLGLVIFFHELGHFAVAKWCRVHVERFSIGFGPILLSRKKGETEYVLSAIPFGGYVKMLGQDDMDPSQLSSEEIAANPRSYSAKTVPQRMAIISAGVIMNVITGLLFFAFAFGIGVESSPSVIGTVQVGLPAWNAGIGYGDEITKINGKDVKSFSDIRRGVALSRGTVEIEGIHPGGKVFSTSVTPDLSGTRRVIGVEPTLGLKLAEFEDVSISPIAPGTAAAAANPTFESGDIVRKIDDTKISSFSQLQRYLARHRSETVRFQVQRGKDDSEELISLSIDPNRFRVLGLWMDFGKISSVQVGSPAAREGLHAGIESPELMARPSGPTSIRWGFPIISPNCPVRLSKLPRREPIPMEASPKRSRFP